MGNFGHKETCIMLARILFSAVIFSSFTAIAVGWDKMEGVGKVSQKGVVGVTADWLKDKDNKFDVDLKFTNEAKNSILIFAGDMRCSRGIEKDGTVDIHSDRRTIDLRPGESRIVVVTCRLQSKDIRGDFSVSFKVFDNPSGDSNTPGKALTGVLTWRQGQTEGKKL
jgi:hypothetical protein